MDQSEIAIVSSMGAVILFGVIGFSVLLWRIYSNPTLASAFSASTATGTPSPPNFIYQWLSTYGKMFINYLPVSLALFGVFADSINQDFRFAIGSLIGISSVFVNYAFSLLTYKVGVVNPAWGLASPAVPANIATGIGAIPATVASRPAQSWCIVTGFSAFESAYTPQSIVFTTSIFMYYLIDFLKNRDIHKNIGLMSLFGGLIGITSVALMTSPVCRGAYYFTGNNFPLSILFAILIGSLCGYLGWQTVSIVASDRLPSAINETFVNKSIPVIKSDKLPGVGKCKSGAEKCDAPSDKEQDQFVCEAYKNGELITSTIAE